MHFNRFLDEIGVRNMWHYRLPPVEATPEEARQLRDMPDEQLHVRAIAPEFQWVERRSCSEVVEEHFTFASQRPSGFAEVDTVWCVRWSRPSDPAAGRRALVLTHGAYASSMRKPLLFVPPVRTAPWDTVLLELPHHLRRQRPDSRYSGAFMVTADIVRITSSILQADCDIRALVHGLRDLGYERIVIGGISIGASPAMQALLRLEVDGAFGIVPSVDAYAGLWESLLGDALRPVGHAVGFTDELARDVLRIITPAALGRPRIPPERILLICGRHDLVCAAAESRRLSRAWGGCRTYELDDGHASLILRYPRVRRLVAAWMRRCLA